MKEKIESLKAAAKSALENCDSEQAIEELRVKYLGKKGELTALLKQMGSLSAEERPIMGQMVNDAKQKLEALIADKSAKMKEKATELKLKSETVDITMPAKVKKTGKLHPLNTVLEDMIDIFRSMGFDVLDGPEVETDHYNFECLNVPADHPARDMQDTFYLGKNLLLRTQTSAAQIRSPRCRVLPQCARRRGAAGDGETAARLAENGAGCHADYVAAAERGGFSAAQGRTARGDSAV